MKSEYTGHWNWESRLKVGKLHNNQIFFFTDYTILQARLTVEDVNDERPTFINEPRPFLATVSSNPSVGELVYELMADDPDIGSSLTYILESG